jgi:hypothetical protein
MLLTIVLDLLCTSGAVVTPGMMVRAWGLQGWAQMAACVLGLGVKAWMYQVQGQSMQGQSLWHACRGLAAAARVA